MRDLGYVEGANVAFTFRFADGQVAKLPALANELVALKPAVIAVGSPAAVLETHKANLYARARVRARYGSYSLSAAIDDHRCESAPPITPPMMPPMIAGPGSTGA
jgi:hypothetical protein